MKTTLKVFTPMLKVNYFQGTKKAAPMRMQPNVNV
jgi:hypothetical protein